MELRFSGGSINVEVSDGEWADVAAVTADEMVAWLNGNSVFAARAIAYIENGRVAIRSRNLGQLYSISLDPGPVTDAVGSQTSVPGRNGHGRTAAGSRLRDLSRRRDHERDLEDGGVPAPLQRLS